MPLIATPSSETPAAAPDVEPVRLRHFLVALDASDHADHALGEAARLAAAADGTVTGIHVYAASLHDRRFRQMESGLPEQFRKESEMERQRAVHDSLISRGLGVISDSYHDAAQAVCERAGVPYRRLSPEGKNYRCIVEAANGGDHDVLVLGALGLGNVATSVVGTVCERVARRAPIDTLIVREPGRALGDGPLVVGIDGSTQSFGALRTALELGRRLDAPVHAVAAFNPFFHYVAFNKIAGVLSEEAGQTFRFKDQEKLHEEIIDSGLEKIYRSHLELARTVAAGENVEIVCTVLEGKPYDAILGYVRKSNASLLLLGKTGIHADAGLDIGGNAENLLRLAPCHVWLGQSSYTPPLDAIARETIAWTEEAEEKMTRVPQAARNMVRTAILRLAQENGHTMVTSSLVDEATQRFCPHRSGETAPEAKLQWSAEAMVLIEALKDAAMRANVRFRAEKQARRVRSSTILPEHVRPFLGEDTIAGPPGTANEGAEKEISEQAAVTWSPEALERLERAPDGTLRKLTRWRVEVYARRHNIGTITPALLEEKYAEWAAGSAKQKITLAWQAAARERIDRIPDFVRGMVILEVERCARDLGKDTVTSDVVEKAIGAWEMSGAFHSRMKPGLYTGRQEAAEDAEGVITDPPVPEKR